VGRRHRPREAVGYNNESINNSFKKEFLIGNMASPFVRIARILKRSSRGDNPLRYDGTVNVADHVELSDIIMKQDN